MRPDRTHRERLRHATLGGVALWVMLPVTAGAQTNASYFDRDRYVGVVERQDPDAAQRGLRWGGWRIEPTLDAGVGVTSNVFAVSDVPADSALAAFEDQSDGFGYLRPAVSAKTDFRRHAFSVGAYTEAFSNVEFSSEAVVNAGVVANAQLDVSRKSALFAGAQYDHLNESRESANSAALFDEPVELGRAKAYLGWRHELGRLRYLARIDLADYDYDDVDLIGVDPDDVTADQDFRDRQSLGATVRVGGAVSPDIELFVEGGYNTQDYGDPSVEGAPTRDSEGANVAIGVDLGLTNKLRAEIAVGAFQQRYDDNAFDDLDGVYVDAEIAWYPHERTTFTLTGRQGADESAALFAGGMVTTEVTARIDQEIRRGLAAYVEGAAVRQDFSGDDLGQEIDRSRVGTGVSYRFNRHAAVELGYSFADQRVEVPVTEGGFGTDYQIHQGLLTVRLAR